MSSFGSSGVKIACDVTSHFDALDTEKILLDSRNRFVGVFLDTAEHQGYHGSLNGVEVPTDN